MHQQPDLVTGDAVVLELPLARLASRGLALAIDVTLQLLLLAVVFLGIVLAGAGDDALVAAVVLTTFVLVRVGYPVLFETLAHGRTPGKMALGLRVVRDDGGPIGFRHALARGLAGVLVDFGPVLAWSAVGVTTSLISSRAKRVGDYLAGTVVVRDRVPREAMTPFGLPTYRLPWTANLDLSAFDDALALAIRQYLGRYNELRPEAREALGSKLAGELVARVGNPPPGTPAPAFLAAVLAERRARG